MDILVTNHEAVVVAEHGLEQHLDRVRQVGDVAVVGECIEPEDLARTKGSVDRGASAKGS